MMKAPPHDNPGECPKHDPHILQTALLEWITTMSGEHLRAECSTCGFTWRVTAKDEVQP